LELPIDVKLEIIGYVGWRAHKDWDLVFEQFPGGAQKKESSKRCRPKHAKHDKKNAIAEFRRIWGEGLNDEKIKAEFRRILGEVEKCHAQKEYLQGVNWCEMALCHASEMTPGIHAELLKGWLFSMIGLLHAKRLDYLNAIDAYSKVTVTAHKSFLRKDPSIRLNLQNIENMLASKEALGYLYCKMGCHESAMSCYIDELKIRRDILGEVNEDVATVLYNIATVHLERLDEEDAIKHFKEATRIQREALGSNSRGLIKTLESTGHAHQQRGDVDLALECYNEVLRIQYHSKSHEEKCKDPDIAKTLNSIANVYLQSGAISKVVEVMSEATRIMERSGHDAKEFQLNDLDLYGLTVAYPKGAAMA
jgi:tetratricopeptide (TPR) repeat protein